MKAFKLYRVALACEGGLPKSDGYVWTTSRREADRIASQYEADHPDEMPCTVEAIEVIPTKRGILAALNKYATHPDNG